MRKVIFLDIDGVLNSYRSCTAYGAYPMDNKSSEKFDEIAVNLIRVACKKCNAEIILSSTWRCDKGWENLAQTLDLPIVDRTPQTLSGDRTHEINSWLEDNVVFEYVIVDDNFINLENFVHTDAEEGLSYKDYKKILTILGEEPDESL